ncbi:MAG: tannase/feruloyl esterase family alpha/beta hydrolase [Proteobacteria bacterium]|nr:tannase/feruloyl esterase family alpha/beta hydrolase [Pseudomonadota bacterium]
MKIQHRSLVVITITFVFMLYGITAYVGVSCSDLMLQPYGGATITSTTMVPADGATPAYCKVTATAGSQNDIEVRLPDNWQKRYLHIGGGGFDGVIPNLNPANTLLQQGYAIAASNGGHRATRTDVPDATFGLDPTLTQDYAYVAIGTTVRVAKALIAAYYGERPKYSYWIGCSNGGRGGYNAAAKYAYEYDGIIAGCPSRNISGAIAGWMQNISAYMIEPSKLDPINAAMVAACDKLDGLEDGVISNSDECSFDPATVSGLDETEVALVNNIHSDVTLPDGTILYSRVGYGPFLFKWIISYYYLGLGHMQYIVYRNPAYDPLSWNLINAYPAVEGVIEGVYDFGADTEALASYLKSGKKLIVWHGADDTLLSHYDTIRTIEELDNAAGCDGRKNLRLYIIPGYGHCEGATGVNRCDLLPVITEWVEKGKAPHTLLASKVDAAGNVLFTRPQCEYPRYPHYVFGDPNKASSFICKTPKAQPRKRSATQVPGIDTAELNRRLKKATDPILYGCDKCSDSLLCTE